MSEVNTGAGSTEDTTYTDAWWIEKEKSCLDYTVQLKVCLYCGRQTSSCCFRIHKCRLSIYLHQLTVAGWESNCSILNHKLHFPLHLAAASAVYLSRTDLFFPLRMQLNKLPILPESHTAHWPTRVSVCLPIVALLGQCNQLIHPVS